MYNEAQKLAFIDTIGDKFGRNKFITVFVNSASMELSLEKDLAYFTKDETIKFISSCDIVDLPSAREYVRRTARYQKFINGSIDFEIKKEDLDFTPSFKKTFFVSPADLIGEIQYGLDENRDPYPSAALYLAWCGLTIDESVELTNDLIDLNSGVIKNTDGEIIVSHIDGLILAQLRAFKSAQIATRTLKQTFDVLPQTTNKFLHKMVSKNSARAEVKKSTLYSSINDFKDYAEIAMHKPSRISYQNALRSGRMYRLYKEEKSGLEVLPQNKDRINSILCSKGDIFDNLFQYRKYKEAFGLQ